MNEKVKSGINKAYWYEQRQTLQNNNTKLKPYPRYKYSGVQWIGEIPEGWEVHRIKSFVPYIKNGQWGDDSSGGNNDFIVLRVADFLEFNFNLNKELTIRNIKDTKLRLKEGDLVIEKSGGGEKQIVGRVVQLKNPSKEKKYTYSNFIGKLEVSNRMNKTFLNYYFKAFYNNGVNFNYIKQTTGIQNLDSASLIQREYFAYPTDKNYQKSIVSFLDKKTAEIDELIEKDKKLIELLKEKRTALINRAVMKGLDPNVKMKDSGIDWIGEIPEGWEVRKVSKSFDIIGSGTTPKSQEEIYYDKGNISWVITGDLNDGLLKETSKKITEEAIKDYNMLKMYPKNSLIIAMYGATIGKIALLNIEACTNQACCVLAKSKIFETKYVFYWFIANKNNIISYSYGGGQPNISQDVIKTLKIPIPPKLEQKAIVEHLDKATEKIDKTIQRIEQKIKLLEEYKKSLIHHTVTGKIDVRGSEI